MKQEQNKLGNSFLVIKKKKKIVVAANQTKIKL